MAEEKECQCYAVRLLIRMTNLLDVWANNMHRAEPGLGKLMEDMHTHLTQQMSKPENEKIRESMKDRLEKVRDRVDKARVGQLTKMQGVESIRNEIHLRPIIRQAFLCEPPGEESSLSKAVAVPMIIMGESNVDDPAGDARKELERIYQELTCGG